MGQCGISYANKKMHSPVAACILKLTSLLALTEKLTFMIVAGMTRAQQCEASLYLQCAFQYCCAFTGSFSAPQCLAAPSSRYYHLASSLAPAH